MPSFVESRSVTWKQEGNALIMNLPYQVLVCLLHVQGPVLRLPGLNSKIPPATPPHHQAPATFLSLPLEIRQAILIDTYEKTWYNRRNLDKEDRKITKWARYMASSIHERLTGDFAYVAKKWRKEVFGEWIDGCSEADSTSLVWFRGRLYKKKVLCDVLKKEIEIL